MSRDVDFLLDRVSQEELHLTFLSALDSRVRSFRETNRKPLEADLVSPLPRLIRLYIFNATGPPGGRPLGEHKIQLMVPGQRRGARGNFDYGGGRTVLLAGYSVEEDVFVLWDAGLYCNFAWSRNVQVKTETLIKATSGMIAEQTRWLRPGGGSTVAETVLACAPERLGDALVRRVEITRNRLMQS